MTEEQQTTYENLLIELTSVSRNEEAFLLWFVKNAKVHSISHYIMLYHKQTGMKVTDKLAKLME